MEAAAARGELCLQSEGPKFAVRGDLGPEELNRYQGSQAYRNLSEQASLVQFLSRSFQNAVTRPVIVPYMFSRPCATIRNFR